MNKSIKKFLFLTSCMTAFSLYGLPNIASEGTHANLGVMIAQAAEIINTWTSGNTIVTLDSEGTLRVTAKDGTDGRMSDDYTYANEAPWMNLKTIKSIVIEEGVIEIGNRAFRSSVATSVSIPDSVEKIDEYAFSWSKIKEVILPNTGNLMLDEGCFSNCVELTKLVLPNNKMKFEDSSLKTIFDSCTSLKELHIPAGFEPINSRNELSFTYLFNNINIERITVEGDNIWKRDYTNNTLVTNDGTMYFWLGNSIISPDVKHIAISSSPIDSTIKAIIIPKTVESISYKSFAYAPNVESIYIGNDHLEGISSFTGDKDEKKKLKIYCSAGSEVDTALREAGYRTYDICSKLLTTDVIYGRKEDALNFDLLFNPISNDDSIINITINDLNIDSSDYAVTNSQLSIFGDSLGNIPAGHSRLKVEFSSGDVSCCDIYSSEDPAMVFESGNTYITLNDSGVLKVSAKNGTDGKMGKNFSDFIDNSCDIKKVIIDDSVTSLALFKNLSADEFCMGSGIKQLESYHFSSSSIGKIKLDKTITSIGSSAFSYSNIGEMYWDVPVYSSYSSDSDVFYKAKINELTFGENVTTFRQIGTSDPSYISRLAEIDVLKFYCDTASVASLNAKTIYAYKTLTSTPSATLNTRLRDLYILGDVNGSAINMPKNIFIHVIENSIGQIWCINNSLAYIILTDEEIDEMNNGKRPTLILDSCLFDGNSPDNISYTVSLGKKPAGASNISKILIDNVEVKSTDWIFNNTDTITISKDYILKLKNGNHTVSVLFDNNVFRSGASLTIINTYDDPEHLEPPSILNTIKYEFYKDYPDYVVIPFTYNRATSIKKVEVEDILLETSDFKVDKNVIIINKDFLKYLSVGKYRISVYFDDNTICSNLQLLVYEQAADRAAPYLLQSRIVFTGQSIVMNFDPGEGEWMTTNILALILDNEIILPNGKRLPFTSSNVNKIKNAYNQSVNKEETVASPSNAGLASPSNAIKKSVNNTSFYIADKKELIEIMSDLDSTKNVFNVSGTNVTLDGDYITNLKLKTGEHLIGAIFDNTERTTDIKKVILTIEGTNKPELPDEPDVPDIPDEPDVPDVPDKPNHNGGSGGSSSSGDGNHTTNGPGVNNVVVNPDNSINVNYTPQVPETGGIFTGSGNDWSYVKPDGNFAKNEWVGSNGYWYYLGADGKLKFDWFQDETNTWYILNREHDGCFGAALTGWYYEKQDNKWYFLNPVDSKMLVGWQFISGQWYYFTPSNDGQTYFGDNNTGWKFDESKNHHPLGSMYQNEMTSDGYFVDTNGVWIK
ncbi:leucine-rich repeat protein [Hungatella hathewayi]|uniref:leucine-rich repeat protein n=1 Tax=Hungatella hathewayi TaxID=154046 RepID=UPI00356496DA